MQRRSKSSPRRSAAEVRASRGTKPLWRVEVGDRATGVVRSLNLSGASHGVTAVDPATFDHRTEEPAVAVLDDYFQMLIGEGEAFGFRIGDRWGIHRDLAKAVDDALARSRSVVLDEEPVEWFATRSAYERRLGIRRATPA